MDEKRLEQEGNFKNAFPWEVESGRESDDPRPLHSQADREPPLTRAEADAAGITPTPEVVYAETDEDENREDERDMFRADPDEHV